MGEANLHNEWAFTLFDYHLDFLKQANGGQDVGHGVDLTNMIDFNQIHLIGRGEVADDLAHRDGEAGLERIRSMIRIASTTAFYQEPDDRPHPDIPTGIVFPEFEGDVIQDGQVVFDETMIRALNQSIVSLVYLRGANHNFFNRMLTLDYRAGLHFFVAQVSPETWLTQEQQEDFMMRYAAAFLAMVTGNREPWGTFSTMEPQPVTMFEYEVIASIYIPGHQRVLAVPSEGANQAYVIATGSATSTFYVQTIPLEATGVFNHPGVLARQDRQLTLYALEWDGNGRAVSFSLLTNDFSAHNALSMYVAVDSSNELNPQDEYQAFTVTLTDSSGTRQSVIIPAGISVLAYHPGHLFVFQSEDTVHVGWAGYMPLGDLRIPFSYFDGVDLSAISDISITFDQSLSGALMLSGIYLK